MLVLSGNIADKQFHLLQSILLFFVCLSVCLSHSFMHYAQTAEDINTI